MEGICLVVFFFSSRRRHTRWTGDWSSDVCSSDLLSAPGDRRTRVGHVPYLARKPSSVAQSRIQLRSSPFGTEASARTPNGSGLSCGRNVHGRKAVEQETERLVGEAAQLFPT